MERVMGLGTFVVLVVLTFLLGIPTTTYSVLRKTVGFWGVGLLFAGAVRLGWVEGFGGPMGLPSAVVWGFAVVAGCMWGWMFARITFAAWSSAHRVVVQARDEVEDSAE